MPPTCIRRVLSTPFRIPFEGYEKERRGKKGRKGKKERKRKKRGERERTRIAFPFADASFSRVRTPVQMDAKKGDEEMFIESSFPFVSITAPFMRRSNVFASPQTIVSMCPETKEKK